MSTTHRLKQQWNLEAQRSHATSPYGLIITQLKTNSQVLRRMMNEKLYDQVREFTRAQNEIKPAVSRFKENVNGTVWALSHLLHTMSKHDRSASYAKMRINFPPRPTNNESPLAQTCCSRAFNGMRPSKLPTLHGCSSNW